MSKNIKEIGKELLGKSLNSFHKKTGLHQLERNNEMQDGILNGILSQVDDAYIEKTEQSNVIHLDGSGDGVVVLDSIEGNTMVNEINSEVLRNWTYSHNTYIGQYANTQEFGIDWSKEVQFNCWIQARNDSNPIFSTLKPNIDYTVWINILENNPTLDGVPVTNNVGSLQLWINGYRSVRQSLPINTTGWVSFNYRWTIEDNSINYSIFGLSISGTNSDGTKTINGGKLRISKEVIVLEGLNTPLNKYFEGIISSFEDKVNEQGKYEIEILSHNNGNLFNNNYENGRYVWMTGTNYDSDNPHTHVRTKEFIEVKNGETLYFNKRAEPFLYDKNKVFIGHGKLDNKETGELYPSSLKVEGGIRYIKLQWKKTEGENDLYVGYSPLKEHSKPHKQNKIKLLLDEPLRGTNVSNDILCIKDGKLVVERRYKQLVLNGNDTEKWSLWKGDSKTYRWNNITDIASSRYVGDTMCDKIPRGNFFRWWNLNPSLGIDYGDPNGLTNISSIYICNPNLDENVTSLRQWLSENNLQVVLPLKEPIYEEVLNEYGEPIILEGYENGTLYIDSTIIPTTTVKYTPKMESLNTLKEVTNNNIMLTNDVNDTIIPYMMEVDLMIMEKEMALPSQINNRKVEVLDMTSMQKRTQEMLERLIKGKTLTEQECKTRITTYLNAGKITDDQAEELMLVISEIYN